MNPPREPAADLPPDGSEEDRGGDLCPNCLTPYRATDDFCHRCGAPASNVSTTLPFETTLAEGFAYRQAVEAPRKFIVVAGMWLIFVPTALAGAAMLKMIDPEWDAPGSIFMNIIAIVIGGGCCIASIIVIWRSTRAYLRQKSTEH